MFASLSGMKASYAVSVRQTQRFAYRFLQIPGRPGHPCRSANGSPYRAHSGLAPPSKSALPGAQIKKA
jgi:hypothetical protein